MRPTRSLLLAAVAALAVCGLGLSSLAQVDDDDDAPRAAPARGAQASGPAAAGRAAAGQPVGIPAFKSEEYLLLGNSVRGAGEPMIAVDPVNPKTMVVVAMGNIQMLTGAPATAGSTDLYHDAAYSTKNWLAVTHDGGVTWDIRTQDAMLKGKLTRCSDAIADVMKDGTMIAGCEPRETASPPNYWGMSAFQVSRDHGKSWGPVVQAISDFQLNRFAAGLKPISGGWPKNDPKAVASNSPWDRPFTYIDDSTGVIYVQAGGGQTELGAPAGQRRSQAYLTASTNGGRSFGTVYAWDSPEWQQQSRGIAMSAAHGVVAVTYIAARAPASEGAQCPCAVLGLSRDMGKSFQYRVLKNITIAPAGPGQGGGGGGGNGGLTKMSLDPTHAGRIALLKSQGADLSVSVSEDWGASWSPWVLAGRGPNSAGTTKQAFEYSRDGVLGMMWRSNNTGGQTFDIYAAISRDGGRTWSRTERVSHASSPVRDAYRNHGLFGDDINDLSMDRDNLYMVWGDNRAGFQGVYYGRLAFKDFQF